MNMWKTWSGPALAAGLLAFAVGCSSGEGAERPIETPAPAAGAETAAEAAGGGTPAAESPGGAAAPAPAPEPENAPDAKNVISVASPQTETIEPKTSEDLYMNDDDREQMRKAEEARQEFNRRNYDVNGTFDPLHPTLMGVSIGMEASAVRAKFGEPTEQYLLPDETVEAAVFAYPGFTIGVREGKVLFVEVSTRSVNPGLNGLRLGDDRQTALAKLGTPTSDTEFVIRYVADGVVLKLDVDPETNEIHSVKLFPEE
ncbi:hypothetical protein [Paenibacillus sp.]|uniref:hypothetical protein n=1 Tax=Paenibacillus sp. TaxID=58172 RepID=UPI002D71C607|nr:hypothetical protein [Paenibacillus sp.]HZG55550.1 hypothetical protein [Paenibacillus sp.]